MEENNKKKASSTGRRSTKEWKKLVAEFQKPDLRRALWQLTNTLLPVLGIWIGLYFLKDFSLWLCIPPAMLAGLFLIRAFIIFHDCGHGSFFKSKKANDALGFFTGMLTFTPTITGNGNTPCTTPPTEIWIGEESETFGLYGGGIPYLLAMDQTELPLPAQPVRTLSDRSALSSSSSNVFPPRRPNPAKSVPSI